MADDTTPAPAATADSPSPAAAANVFRAPGPIDPFLEPLTWSVAGRWPLDVEDLRRSEAPATNRRTAAARDIISLHTSRSQQARQAPFAPLEPGPDVELFANAWNVINDDLGDQLKWLTGIRPDQLNLGALTQADFVVLLGQVMRAILFRVMDRKLSDLDYLRGYTAQMHADWRPLAQADPTRQLQPGVAVDRYNWLLRRARRIVVKKSQHVAQLDEINLDELKRTTIVLDYSLMHLTRAVSFA